MSCLLNARAWFGSYESGGGGASTADRRHAHSKLEGVLASVRAELAQKRGAEDALRVELAAKTRAYAALAQSGLHRSARGAALRRDIEPLAGAMKRVQMDVAKLQNTLRLLEQRHVLLTQSNLQQDVVGALDSTNRYVAMGDARYDADAITDVIESAGQAHIAAMDKEQETDAVFSSAIAGTRNGEDVRYSAFARDASHLATTQEFGDADAFLTDIGDILGENFAQPATAPLLAADANYYTQTFPTASNVDPAAAPTGNAPRNRRGPDDSSAPILADW